MFVEEQREELRRILQSSQFRRAPKLQKLLAVICEYHFENREHEINEPLIAREAFGKGPGFQAGQDSIVRVQAREARRRLKEYYREEGKSDRLILEIPIRSYIPVFTPAEPVVEVPGKQPRPVLPKLVLGAALIGLALTLLYTVRHAALHSTQSPPLSPPLATLWNRFLNSNAPTILVLSNPAVTSCDPDETAAAAAKGAPPGPQESCPDEFTGMGEAEALYPITNIFRSGKARLSVRQSRVLKLEEAESSNLIMLGGKMVNPWTERYGADLPAMNSDNVLPSVSESIAGQFRSVFDAKTRRLAQDRGAIALRRQPGTGLWRLFLYGAHGEGTHAAADAACDERFLSRVQWPSSSQSVPDRFQILLSVKIKEGASLETVPLALQIP